MAREGGLLFFAVTLGACVAGAYMRVNLAHVSAAPPMGMRAGAAGSGTLTLQAGSLSSYGVGGGGELVVALPGGVFDLPSVMSLTTPTIITGAGVGTTTLRGSCGVGGIAAAGVRVDARNMSLVGVSFAASGAGAQLVLSNVSISWDGCRCADAPIARVDAGATMRLISSDARAPGACAVSVTDGSAAFSQLDVAVRDSRGGGCARDAHAWWRELTAPLRDLVSRCLERIAGLGCATWLASCHKMRVTRCVRCLVGRAVGLLCREASAS
jgi:hypothetical protein